MNEAACEYLEGESDFALRPVVSSGKTATPGFEVLTLSDRPVVDHVPAILRCLDDGLPGTCRGRTHVFVSLDDGEVFDKSFPANFADNVRLHNIRPSRVELEVCESVVSNETAWQRVIPALAGYGFRVVVKRFFADSSDFDVLASPHIAAIKLAPQVIADLPGSALARGFLKGLKALAAVTNKQLIVEGVETLGQALWLEAMGCETFQGGFFGPVMDVHAARRFVLEGRQVACPIAFEPFTLKTGSLP